MYFDSQRPTLPTTSLPPTRLSGENGEATMASDDDRLSTKPVEDATARELLDRFTRGLISIARRQLDVRLRHKIEPEDVVQSAYKSFFLRYGEDALGDADWRELWGLLTCITLRKCADRVRYHRAKRRDISREAPPRRGTSRIPNS